MRNINEVLEDMRDSQEDYNYVIDELIEELKCIDCTELRCRICRLAILKDLQNNIDKLCDWQ